MAAAYLSFMTAMIFITITTILRGATLKSMVISTAISTTAAATKNHAEAPAARFMAVLMPMRMEEHIPFQGSSAASIPG